jgi:hypothetical protein
MEQTRREHFRRLEMRVLLTGMWPGNPASEGGVTGHNKKGNCLTGKPVLKDGKLQMAWIKEDFTKSEEQQR